MQDAENAAAGARAGTVKKLFSGTAVLTAAALMSKIVGLIYKIPLIKYVGIEGMAYFLAANHIYVLLFVISTSGLPVAVAVMISSAVARADRSTTVSVFRTALVLFLIIGGAGSLVMIAGAEKIASWISIPEASRCLTAIAPAVLMACVSGALRGYFQGHQVMRHTAVSQVIEAAGKLGLGLAGAVYAVRRGYAPATVAAYAITGITAGVGLSMLYLIAVKAGFDKRRFREKTSAAVTRTLAGRLIKLALPVTLSSAVISLTGVIDTALISNCLRQGGFTEQAANRLYSCYGNLAIPMFSLTPSLIAPVAMALVPLISSARSASDDDKERTAICSAVKMSLLVAIPASLGLSVFSKPLLSLIFASDSGSVITAAPLLSLLSLSVVPACLITTTNAVLQAQRKAGKTIISMAWGAALKTAVEFWLVRQPAINIYGAPISTFLCDVTVVIINIYYVVKSSPGLKGLVRSALLTALSSFAAIGAAGMLWRFSRLRSYGTAAILPAVATACGIYIISALLTGAADKEIMDILPFGKKEKSRGCKENEQTGKNRISIEKGAFRH